MNETERNTLAIEAAKIPALTAARDEAREALVAAKGAVARCTQCGHKNEPRDLRKAFNGAAVALSKAEGARQRIRVECLTPVLLQEEDTAGVRLRAAEQADQKAEADIVRARENVRVLKAEGGERNVRESAAAELLACEEAQTVAHEELRDARTLFERISRRVDGALAKALEVKVPVEGR